MRILKGYDMYEQDEMMALKDDYDELPDINSTKFAEDYLFIDIKIRDNPGQKNQIIKDMIDLINDRAKFCEPIYCAECGKEIEDSYLMIGDNFLQVKYFDSSDDNIFCSEDCLTESLSVLSVEVGSEE